jgi:two-component sensor histidine kinase
MWHTTFEPLIWRVKSGYGPKPTGSLAMESRMGLASAFAASTARSDDLPSLQQEICRVAAEGLGVTFAKLLVYDSEKRNFLLQAGVGWPDGIVGTARLDADVATAAGFAWCCGESIISNSLLAERRFRVPDLLIKYGIVRSINVVVPGDDEAAFGVLEVESPEPGIFTNNDVAFLQNLALSLASSIARATVQKSYEEQAKHSSDDYQLSLREFEHRVRNDLQVIYGNVALEGHNATVPEQAARLERISYRIMALSHLYDHLLRQRPGRRVDLGLYLSSLCEKIAQANDLSARGLRILAQTEQLMVPADRAVKLGIVVNELITNAVKHAFLDASGGEIAVTVTAGGRDEMNLPMVSVADNGCGFGGPRSGSAGMTFVETLIQQAGGVLTRGDGNGTVWRIQLSSQQALPFGLSETSLARI